MKRVKAKFGNMRRDEDFVVYPQGSGMNDANFLRLQSNHRCLLINVTTGVGQLSKYVANYPNFQHCSPHNGGTVVNVSQAFIAECQAAQPQKGDSIGGGVGIIG